jgi:hypothetical protein
MPINWDEKLFAPVHAVFCDEQPVTYLPVTGSPFPIADAIFEEAYQAVTELVTDPAVITETPAITVRLATFPAGSLPQQNDRIRVPSMTSIYMVREVQLDRHAGTALLLLNLTPGDWDEDGAPDWDAKDQLWP